MVLSMTSSSSCSSNIQIKSGPIDGNVLWMQGQEEIPEEIIPLLRQSGFYWIMKMRYLKINAALISALIERWKPETHTFHMRCGESTITLQDADLCKELLGVRPQEGELQGSTIKLSWLAHHFPQLNNHDGNLQQLDRFTRAWILRFIGGVLFVDKSSSKVSLRECNTYAWGPAVLGYLYREMCSATDYKTKSIGGMCILIQMWAWERCTSLAPKRTPPVIENKPLGHRWLRRGNQHIGNDNLIVFRRKLDIMKRHERSVVRGGATNLFPRCPSQPLNIHGITLKGKQDENWGQLFAPMINQWNNRADFRVDGYPRQKGLLSFNSDYMVWYRRKTKMFVDPKNASTITLTEVVETLQYMVSPQGRNTWIVDDLVPYVEKITILSEEQDRINEPMSHGPATEHQFPAQEFHILQSSVETQGIGR
ncbi:Serine/threonine-protein phosphatase 7 long form [Glycine soja]